jgi:hypothetical protein
MTKPYVTFNPDSLKWEVRATVKRRLVTIKSFWSKEEAESFKSSL